MTHTYSDHTPEHRQQIISLEAARHHLPVATVRSIYEHYDPALHVLGAHGKVINVVLLGQRSETAMALSQAKAEATASTFN